MEVYPIILRILNVTDKVITTKVSVKPILTTFLVLPRFKWLLGLLTSTAAEQHMLLWVFTLTSTTSSSSFLEDVSKIADSIANLQIRQFVGIYYTDHEFNYMFTIEILRSNKYCTLEEANWNEIYFCINSCIIWIIRCIINIIFSFLQCN